MFRVAISLNNGKGKGKHEATFIPVKHADIKWY